MKEHETKITPTKDLMNSALQHYEEASNSIHHHYSDIPKAIKFYYEYKGAPTKFEEVEETRKIDWVFNIVWGIMDVGMILCIISVLDCFIGFKHTVYALFGAFILRALSQKSE